MKNLLIFMTLWLVFSFNAKTYSCTIFYVTDGINIYAGNNEDWKDPDSKMWFYPPADNKLGWIKFGWGSGFPQGGMNESGLFWDASSCAHLPMPYSEANKTKLDFPIMQKIIESCSTIEEAREILNKYYCEDQYRGQYLIGDASGNSIIVEGDNIVLPDSNYQVLTNFYHSHPEMGGYPCWRHDAAIELLTADNDLSPYFIGSVLAATHQEGKYPTQYSNIYDLKNASLYLFYSHNYEEFLEIKLADEIENELRSYDIPKLFSSVKLISPNDGEELESSPVLFKWEGVPGSNYKVLFSTDPDFTTAFCLNAGKGKPLENKGFASLYYVIPLLLLLFLSWFIDYKKLCASMLILGLVLTVSQCKKQESPVAEREVVEMNHVQNNLDPNTVYYWKVKAQTDSQDVFETETRLRSFKTAN